MADGGIANVPEHTTAPNGVEVVFEPPNRVSSSQNAMDGRKGQSQRNMEAGASTRNLGGSSRNMTGSRRSLGSNGSRRSRRVPRQVSSAQCL